MSKLLSLVLVLMTTCDRSGAGGVQSMPANTDPRAIRYLLKLRHNPVDPGAAFRCYGACQSMSTPKEYVECLSECPGFERTPGMKCDPGDVPPEAACITVFKIPKTSEPDPGLVVLGVVGQMLLVVGLVSVCQASATACQSNAGPF